MKDLIVSLKEEKKQEPVLPPKFEPRNIPPRQKRGWRHLRIIALAVAALCALGAIGYFVWFSPKSDLPTTPEAPQIKSAEEIKAEISDVITQVGRHIVLPEGEEPTVATVTEPEKLQDQPFFKNAKPGHKVLIYTQARKAYLYDPVADKLVEAAPLLVDVPQQ